MSDTSEEKYRTGQIKPQYLHTLGHIQHLVPERQENITSSFVKNKLCQFSLTPAEPSGSLKMKVEDGKPSWAQLRPSKKLRK